MSKLAFPYTGSFERFTFPGFSRPGHCYLKYHVNTNGRTVFLCSQLRGSTGTSVTNAMKDIFTCAVEQLDGLGVFEALKVKKGFFKPSPNLLMEVANSCRWVEHYPAGTGMLPVGSYSLVNFDSQLNPMWSHMGRASIAAACEMPESFFDLSDEDLTYAAR